MSLNLDAVFFASKLKVAHTECTCMHCCCRGSVKLSRSRPLSVQVGLPIMAAVPQALVMLPRRSKTPAKRCARGCASLVPYCWPVVRDVNHASHVNRTGEWVRAIADLRHRQIAMKVLNAACRPPELSDWSRSRSSLPAWRLRTWPLHQLEYKAQCSGRQQRSGAPVEGTKTFRPAQNSAVVRVRPHRQVQVSAVAVAAAVAAAAAVMKLGMRLQSRKPHYCRLWWACASPFCEVAGLRFSRSSRYTIARRPENLSRSASQCTLILYCQGCGFTAGCYFSLTRRTSYDKTML